MKPDMRCHLADKYDITIIQTLLSLSYYEITDHFAALHKTSLHRYLLVSRFHNFRSCFATKDVQVATVTDGCRTTQWFRQRRHR